MAELSLSINGTPDELLRAILALKEVVQPDKTRSEFDADAFAAQLTAPGRRVVRAVALASYKSQAIPREELLGLIGQDQQFLAGVFGGIGLHWKATSSEPNPFRGQWNGEIEDIEYRIDHDHAAKLLAVLTDNSA